MGELLLEAYPTKVLHVMDSGGVYGAEVLVLGLMEAQSRAGHKPILASIGARRESVKPIEAEARARGLHVEAFRFLPGPNPLGALRVLGFARRVGADVIHVHGYRGDILLGFAPRRLRPAPIVSTVHGWTGAGRRSRLTLYEWLDAKVLGRLDAVAVVHEGMLAHPRLAGRGLRLVCVENGLPPRPVTEAPAPDDPVREFARGAFVVGSVGRLSPEKGLDVLINAFAALRPQRHGGAPTRLIFVGDGPERRALEARVRDLRLESRVCFAGYRKDARYVLAAFSVFVLPSYTEGLPMTVLEAMDAGVPVVASAVGGIPRVLDGGAAGYLVEPGHVEQLSDAIDRVRRGGDGVRAVSTAARARVCDVYSMERCARDYDSLYRSTQGMHLRGEEVP